MVYRESLEVWVDGETLAPASITGSPSASRDAGEHWHCVSNDLPPIAAVQFKK